MRTYSAFRNSHQRYALSLFAWGQLGRSIVLDYNRQGAYHRAYRIPSNFPSEARLQIWQVFSDARESWAGLTESQREAWNLKARGSPVMGVNLYMGEYIKSNYP